MSAPLKTVRDRYSDVDIERYYRAGFWQPSSFSAVVRARAASHPDKTYVCDDAESLTYSEFAEKSLRLAVGLKRAGVRRGERVAAQLPNWTEFPLLAAALNRIGAILVPIMPIYRENDVAYVIDHAGVSTVVTCGKFRGFDHAAMFAELKKQNPQLREVYVTHAGSALGFAHGKPLDALYADGDINRLEHEAGPDTSPDDGFVIVYTSGTTSRPKGCFHTFNTLRASALGIAKSIRYSEQDVQFGPSPITHSTGIITSVLLPLLHGTSSYLMDVWDPAVGLERIKEHGCTCAVTATAFLQMLIAAFDPGKHDPSSLRVWICAGAPIPGSVVEKAREMFGCHVLSLYGRSENMLTTMCTIDDPAERSATSDGRALAGAEVKIVDKEGREVPRGEEGDIAYRGPSHMIEYFRNEEETAKLFTPDGFSRSGDLGRADENGYIRVTGRLKDIVIRGGMNISARELEDHLVTHPKVGMVAIVGMPDERLGEKVCAYVVPADPGSPPTLEELNALLAERKVARQKFPERLEVVSTMPTTATGKIQKHVLRADIAKKLA